MVELTNQPHHIQIKREGIQKVPSFFYIYVKYFVYIRYIKIVREIKLNNEIKYSGIPSSLYLVERVVGRTWVQAPPGVQLKRSYGPMRSMEIKLNKCIMDFKDYESPQIAVIEVEVEKGFAASNEPIFNENVEF